jgi:multidrug efflux pump subunit AcrB
VNISELFIRRPIVTSLLMGALAMVGMAAFPLLPVAPLPQVDFPTVQVQAQLPGASSDTMASTVASPLERQFGQIPGITQMTSTSVLGSTSITLQFDLNRNIDAAARDAQAAITAASRQLPTTLTTPPTYKGQSGGFADPDPGGALGHAPTDRRRRLCRHGDRAADLADHRCGAGNHRRRAEADDPSGRPAKLQTRGLTFEDVRAVRHRQHQCGQGQHQRRATSFTIAANDQLTKAEPYNDVIIAYRNGAPIRVRDVGHAVAGPQDVNIAALKGSSPSVILLVFKQPGANVIDTVDKIKAAMPQLSSVIPPGLHLETIVDRTQTIRASVLDVEFTLALTIVLVVMVIFLFLLDLRATLIPAVTVPLALLGAVAMMYLLGFSLDNLSLMAMTIAVGFVVDDAIVVTENIYRHVEDGMPATRRDRGAADRLRSCPSASRWSRCS